MLSGIPRTAKRARAGAAGVPAAALRVRRGHARVVGERAGAGPWIPRACA
jgi:hypothetical protein